MDQEKIDRLFREKLNSMEVAPSASSWSEVEKQISTRSNSFKFYWAAAAISTLLIGWIIWPSLAPEKLTPIASEVSHPMMEIKLELVIPPLVAKEETKIDKFKAKVKEKIDTKLAVQEPPKKVIEKLVENTFIETIDQNNEMVVADNSEPEIVDSPSEDVSEKVKIDLKKVKITYIASAKKEVKQEVTLEKDSVNAFKKLFALAGKISPGDVLADIRTAKDDFINGGFKNNQKQKASL